MTDATDATDAKRAVRRSMRAVRRSVADPAARSTAIWNHVRALPAVERAGVVMAFDSIPGEPDTRRFLDWCRSVGKEVVVPAADPAAAPPDDPERIDVAVVPGVAFTAAGDRLGQGGGWYDRLLATMRCDALAVGVCFEEQLVESLPTEPHDRPVDIVVTDAGNASGGGDPPIPSARNQ